MSLKPTKSFINRPFLKARLKPANYLNSCQKHIESNKNGFKRMVIIQLLKDMELEMIFITKLNDINI